MKWRIKAVDRETGKPVPDTVVEAASEEEAMALKGGNTLVESVRPLGDAAPDYSWLKLLAGIYSVGGGLLVLGSVFVGLVAVIKGVISPDSIATYYVFVATVGSMFLSGAVLLAVGQLLYGFRDIARNSWKLPEIATMLRH